MYKIPKESLRVMLLAIFVFSTLSVGITVAIYELSGDTATEYVEIPTVEEFDVTMYEYRIDSLKSELALSEQRREGVQKTLDVLIEQRAKNKTQKNEELEKVHFSSDSASVAHVNEWLSSDTKN